uniref:diguanylate cyclase n=1 Tax=Paractinoplanes polyasparticus TaxID=2856853 RepID=UPI001C8518B8|nr:diguanylate cyclase [Actinoplanes polyasparticus]
MAAHAGFLLLDGERTRVERVANPGGGRAIRKRALGPDAAARIAHERTILRRLAGTEGIATLMAIQPESPVELLLSDAGELDLALVLQSGPIEAFRLPVVMAQLARTLGAIHRAGVIHRDLNPSNIVLDGRRGAPTIIDFDLATTFTELRPAFTHPRDILGNLAYLAPEQTGRTARPVDMRSDIYGLGATIYALATGDAPCPSSSDPLSTVRAILALVPPPLTDRVPGISPMLSAIVARTLEKEPERRYQTVAGLLRDLERVVAEPGVTFDLGTRDFPERLSPPTMLIGRDAEVATLRSAFEAAQNTSSRAVLVTGAAGTGKSSLINTLIPVVTGYGGLFVAAKHDQFRQDSTLDGVMRALRDLVRLLLAEPQEQLDVYRERILRRLGTRVSSAADLFPELSALLGAEPVSEPADPVQAAAQMHRLAQEILLAVVSPERPLVLVLDDLQWASRSALSFTDALLTDPDLRGLLLVGAFREDEVGPGHPLTALRERWNRIGASPLSLRMQPLPAVDQARMLAAMLQLEPGRARDLAGAIDHGCRGNPLDMIELINALRRNNVLVPGDTGWIWDDDEVVRHIGEGDVLDLLADRLQRLPAETVDLLQVMACLGIEVSAEVLGAATGLPLVDVRDRLVPALEDGLLGTVDADVQRGDDKVWFRHDRVQQAVYADLGEERHGVRLAAARNLTANPNFEPEAAEQYLAVYDLIQDAAERDTASSLFEVAADAAGRVSNFAAADRFLDAAIRLGAADPEVPSTVLLRREIARHTALYHLGRLDEADALYGSLTERGAEPLSLVPATCVQISSLTHRARLVDALTLGTAVLAELGRPLPRDGLRGAVEEQMNGLYGWITNTSREADLARPDTADAKIVQLCALVSRMTQPAYFAGEVDLHAWLVLQVQQMWVEFGPCQQMIGGLAAACAAVIGVRRDYQTGALVTQRMIDYADDRGYQGAGGYARFLYASVSIHWTEPLENTLTVAAVAREAMITTGNLATAPFPYMSALAVHLEVGPSVDDVVHASAAALELTLRTGNNMSGEDFMVYRQFGRALNGTTTARASLLDADFDEEFVQELAAANPLFAAYVHIHQALLGLIFDDAPVLIENVRAVAPWMPALRGVYLEVLGRLLTALAAARMLRDGSQEERDRARADLHQQYAWFVGRAEEMPENFRHLQLFISAEQAWADENIVAALRDFDRSLHLLRDLSRPWHRAVISERNAALHREIGLDRAADGLLDEARKTYEMWGAAEKVRQLDERRPRPARELTARSARTSSTGISQDQLEMLAVLRASQMISSGTDLDQVQATVAEQMQVLTGATTVRLLVADDGKWSALSDDNGLPVTAVRYVMRTENVLSIADATRDERFRHDPCFANVERCALMVVPIRRHGAVTAILVLENRLSSGMFTVENLNTVELIAGQLAVTIANATLYRTLEARVEQRTAELREANRKLAALSATDMLTSIGNRRHFIAEMDRHWPTAKGSGTPISVLMVDVDHFKAYNDHYGHPAGDECLRQIALAISTTIRGSDVACRYGGEEFVAILPGSTADAAVLVAERVRASVEALALPHEGSPRGVVSISVGVAGTVPEGDQLPESLVEAADGALYRAKRNGRNQVCR